MEIQMEIPDTGAFHRVRNGGRFQAGESEVRMPAIKCRTYVWPVTFANSICRLFILHKHFLLAACRGRRFSIEFPMA